MDRATEREIRRLAGNCCEYCRLPEHAVKFRHVIDHIIARQHGGSDRRENLALSCGRCNRFKGPNIASIDPETGRLTQLFNPRTDDWRENFRLEGAVVVGTTEVGRATVFLLEMNDVLRLAARGVLLQEGIRLE
jgi:hypothetical protein